MARYFLLTRCMRADCGSYAGWRLSRKDGGSIAFLTTHDMRRLAQQMLPDGARDICVDRGDQAHLLRMRRSVTREGRARFLAALDDWVERVRQYQ